MSQSDLQSFSLEELHKHGTLLIANGRVYLGIPNPPSWLPVAALDSLEELDLALTSGVEHLENWRCEAEEGFLSLLPDVLRPVGAAIMTFCVQAERYRMGKPAQPFVPSSIVRAMGSLGRLGRSLGAAVALLCHGIIFIPRVRLSDPVTQIPVQAAAFLPIVQPGSALTLEQLKEFYLTIPELSCETEEAFASLKDDLEAATTAVARTVPAGRTHLNCRVIYDCPDTGLSVLLQPSGQPMFTVASGPFVAEDASGTLYRFDGFTLAAFLMANGAQLAATPRVMDPPVFRHWHPNQLHMCTYQPERPIANPLQLDNCVSLLLSGRHMLRAGLYNQPGARNRPTTLGFADRRISGQDADRLGLPVYPYNRQSS